MANKVGSLQDHLQREYEWQCSSCNYAFKNQAKGLKCPKCGGTLLQVQNPEHVKEKLIGD